MHLGHMASYREALRYSYGRRVLDLGCGAGYGAFFLAGYGASHVTAVDISGVALAMRAASTGTLSMPCPNGRRAFAVCGRGFDFVFLTGD
jgi:methylase of polypeptide subunit release factors